MVSPRSDPLGGIMVSMVASAGSEPLRLSVVIPMFNEAAVLRLLFERLRPALNNLSSGGTCEYEVVCVDDGSRDGTAQLVLAEILAWRELRLVRLLRNVGHQGALTAGLESARGDFVISIDADLQDPPETIAEMLRVAVQQQLDVVYGVRSDRSSDSALKRRTAGIYYKVMRRIAGPQLPDDAGDFRLISRRVIEALRELPEHGRVYRLVIPWFGFPSAQVRYVRERRAAGRTKYPLARMVSLAFDSVAAFSPMPLRFATLAGVVGVLIALFAMVWSLVGWLSSSVVPGWTSILATVGLIGAIQLICLGLLGEYVSRIFVAGQRRPTYLVGYDSADDAVTSTTRGAWHARPRSFRAAPEAAVDVRMSPPAGVRR